MEELMPKICCLEVLQFEEGRCITKPGTLQVMQKSCSNQQRKHKAKTEENLHSHLQHNHIDLYKVCTKIN